MTDSQPLPRTRQAGHPPERELELAAFASTCAPSTTEHLTTCDQCRARVLDLEADRRAFLTVRPVRPFVDGIVQKFEPRPTESLAQPWRTWRWGALAAALGLVAIVAVTGPLHPGQIATKGAAALGLRVLVSRAGAPAIEWPEPAHLQAGDILKLEASVPWEGFVYVANLDEEGRVTRYFPERGEASVRVAPGQRLLPGSIVLDAFEGRELIVLLWSDRPLVDAEVREALTAAYRAEAGQLDRIKSVGLPGFSALHLHDKDRPRPSP